MTLLDDYAEEFLSVASHLPGFERNWLNEHRQASLRVFLENGIPTPQLESWKYTNLRVLGQRALPLASTDCVHVDRKSLKPFLPKGLGGRTLVFVNGWLRRDLSDDMEGAGGTVTSLASALQDGQLDSDVLLGSPVLEPERALHSLNGAFMTDGALIRFTKGKQSEGPYHLLFVTAPGADVAATHPRNIVVAERDSVAEIVETHVGLDEGTYWSNSYTRIFLESGSHLRHHRFQGDSLLAHHIGTTLVEIGTGAKYEGFSVAIGGKLARHEISAHLTGTDAGCDLTGIYLGYCSQHIDNTIQVHHLAPHGRSRQVYRGVLDGEARGVFQGKVVVAPDAQGVDAHQLNQNLILSSSAEIDTKPELEINANDVKCTHGATVGALDEDALFYMQSRGIPRGAATDMLIDGFVNELCRESLSPVLSEWFGSMFASWMMKRHER